MTSLISQVLWYLLMMICPAWKTSLNSEEDIDDSLQICWMQTLWKPVTHWHIYGWFGYTLWQVSNLTLTCFNNCSSSRKNFNSVQEHWILFQYEKLWYCASTLKTVPVQKKLWYCAGILKIVPVQKSLILCKNIENCFSVKIICTDTANCSSSNLIFKDIP